MKVVFDTNVLVSALVFPGGRGEEALLRVLAERDELVLSLARVALFLADIGTIVKPRRRLAVLKDAADNRILECALAGRAQAVVSGDKALLALQEYRGVRVLSLADYLKTA